MLRCFAMSLSLIMFVSIGTLKAETLALATDPFNEEVLKAARISGSLITGIQQQGPSGNSVAMEAYVPTAWAGDTLCAHVVSVNGLYEAKNEYLISDDWSGGYADLEYPTRHINWFKTIAHDEIGIRLSRGDCTSQVEEAIVARWNNGPSKLSAMLVNSFQAEAVFAYIGDTATPIRCRPLELDGKSAYDTRCPLSDVNATGAIEVQILRIVKGKSAPPTSLTLWLQED